MEVVQAANDVSSTSRGGTLDGYVVLFIQSLVAKATFFVT